MLVKVVTVSHNASAESLMFRRLQKKLRMHLKNNVHNITKIILHISEMVANWVSLEKALQLIDEALKTSLKNATYESGFFNRDKMITGGNKLSTV